LVKYLDDIGLEPPQSLCSLRGLKTHAFPAGVVALRSNQLVIKNKNRVMEMMTRNNSTERDQLEIITIDQLVPQDHLVRKLEGSIDFSFIYPLVENLYSTLGRPSIDPVVLIKMTFIQYVFGIRSMRQTIKEIETNVAYRWFLGFGFYTEIPHFSTFGKNYERRFKETDLFEQIFHRILQEITDRGLLSADHVFIDSTHVKASANKRKFEKKVVRKETRAYEPKLQEELNQDRIDHGKKPFPLEKFEKEEMKEIKQSLE
jgi:transposase